MRRILRVLANPLTMFMTLPWLMILLIAGTIAQKYMSIEAACTIFFSSFILWLGPFPLPGGYSIIGFIGLCLLVKFLFYSTWQWKRAGTILAHFGVLILLIGSALTAAFSQESSVTLGEHQSSSTVIDKYSGQERELPFTLSLTKVTQYIYPGTEKASEYESKLVIQDRGTKLPAVISMNNPLHYRGYTFYQASYIEQDGLRKSTLAVVYNIGSLFPYISASLITFGLVLHIALHMRKKGRKS